MAVRAEGDPSAIGAEDGINVVGFVHGHRPRYAADRLNRPDVAQITEGDQLAVRGNIRRASESNRLLTGCWRIDNEKEERKKQSDKLRAHGDVPVRNTTAFDGRVSFQLTESPRWVQKRMTAGEAYSDSRTGPFRVCGNCNQGSKFISWQLVLCHSAAPA